MSWLNDAWNWVEDKVEDTVAFFRSVGEWLKEGILSLPLLYSSLMGKYFPGSTLGDAQFFTPSHSDPDVAALLTGSKWKDGATITYALPDSRGDYADINPSATGFERLSAQNEAAVHQVMASVAGFVDRGVAYAGRDDAMIQVAGMRPGTVITDSHGYYPGMPLYAGETWLKSGSETSVPKGSYNYYMVLHELGHSLGLKHTHDSVPGLRKISASLDSTEYTVMSYNNYSSNSPQSFMQYDIAALQAMYGADFVTNSGNTIYTWSHTGEMFLNGAGQGQTLNTRIFLTVWDGGGIDTYDMSNFTENALIDLAPGGFSRFSSGQLAYRYDGRTKVNGNVYNAFQYNGDARSLIENAVGGSGSDRILGNQADNHLQGRAGDDELSGFAGNDSLIAGDGNDVLLGGAGNDAMLAGEGNDRLDGGAGADRFDGGGGRDTVSYWSAAGAVHVYLAAPGYNRGEALGDSYTGIEVIDGSRFNDTLEGNADANTFWGDTGNDQMKGGAGADTLSGGDGDDRLEGGAGADHFNGGNGRDTVSYWSASGAVQVYLGDPSRSTGEAFGDTFVGIEVVDGSVHSDVLEGNGDANTFWADAGHDLLRGWGGNDTLKGAAGDDWLVGGTGGDLLDGGDGYDTADYSEAAGRVIVDRQAMSRNQGEAQGDTYVSIEGIVGSRFNDEFYGGAGWDGFWSGAGDDILEGRGGGDHLNGGDGFDFAVYWSSGGVKASLLYSYLNTGDAAGDKYELIEGLQGSSWNDTLQGNHQANTLYGWGGNDELLGEGGNDYIEGGDGFDTISGGDGLDWLLGNAGRDVFRFDTWLSASNVDTLADFNPWEDTIQLSRNIFGRVTGGNYLDISAFTTGSAATSMSHRIIYNKTTGDLFYDADGSEWAAGQVKFASIGAGHNLMNSHFLLFW